MPTPCILLDTHVFLWWCADDDKLSQAAQSIISEAEVVLISSATSWEAYIKSELGKLKLPGELSEAVTINGFQKLPIGFTHAKVAAELPKHHSDPFDRMLVAQAKVEGISLITQDKQLAAYSADIVLV